MVWGFRSLIGDEASSQSVPIWVKPCMHGFSIFTRTKWPRNPHVSKCRLTWSLHAFRSAEQIATFSHDSFVSLCCRFVSLLQGLKRSILWPSPERYMSFWWASLCGGSLMKRTAWVHSKQNAALSELDLRFMLHTDISNFSSSSGIWPRGNPQRIDSVRLIVHLKRREMPLVSCARGVFSHLSWRWFLGLGFGSGPAATCVSPASSIASEIGSCAP